MAKDGMPSNGWITFVFLLAQNINYMAPKRLKQGEVFSLRTIPT